MRLASIQEAVHKAPGTYRAPCPHCDRGPKDDAVGVTVEYGGRYVWHCHRCHAAGALKRAEKPPERPQEPRTPEHRPDGLAEWAAELWHTTRPLGGDALGYLRARTCVIPPPDSDLRWHPRVKHSPSGHVGPALVALVTDAITAKPISLHRTWIRTDGTKADIRPARMMAAAHCIRGGAIRLWPDDAVTYGLAIAEGIETALSVAHAFTPVWSVIDAGNMAAFPVLDGIESLLIAADSDAHQKGQRAARECAARWLAAGREVSIAEPDPGKDWNDEAAE